MGAQCTCFKDPVPTRLLRRAVGWGLMLVGVSYILVKVPVRLVSTAENVSIDLVGGPVSQEKDGNPSEQNA